jgi:hypothetical protein
MSDKSLFIPLKSKFYDAFIAGTKTVEYRRHGPGWNAKTCAIGRRVVLSKGYGKANRVTGTIVGFLVSTSPTYTDAWRACYGCTGGEAACIKIALDVEPRCRCDVPMSECHPDCPHQDRLPNPKLTRGEALGSDELLDGG